jgi:hypothetical protein
MADRNIPAFVNNNVYTQSTQNVVISTWWEFVHLPSWKDCIYPPSHLPKKEKKSEKFLMSDRKLMRD